MPVDLRSDTVTQPTAAMRRAMAEAEVGDDVYGEDPTVRRLEAEVARLLGKEDALFVPTGCMGNQLAARLWTHPGEEVALGHESHAYDWELAGLAALAGVQARPLSTERGRFRIEDVRAALRPAGGFRPACRLLMVENTHNFQGGAVVPLEHLRALREVALVRGARVHLDGARLWNACAASGVEPAAYAATADSVMVCFSKGLCAPVGSALAGERAFIARAREARKLLGGGMRQAGVLAAPALLALQVQRARLSDDHARARRLAAALGGLPGVVLPHGTPETNIVFVRVPGRDAQALKAALAAGGVLVGATGPETLRLLTHMDVDDAGLEHAIAALRRVLAA